MEISNETFEEFFSVTNESLLLEDEPEVTFINFFTHFPLNVLVFFIYAFGITGNFLVIVIVIRKKTMQTSLNLFLATISVVDMISSIYELTLGCIHILFGIPVINETMCHAVFYLYQVEGTLPPLMLAATVITFICKENRVPTYKAVTLTIFITAMIFAIPRGYFTTLEIIGKKIKICTEKWSSQDDRNLYKHFESTIEAFAFLLSFVACIVKYKMFRSASAAKSITQKLPLLIFIAIILWTPKMLIRNFEFYSIFGFQYYLFIFKFEYVTNCLSFAFKPIMYFYYDKDFYKELKNIIKNPSDDSYALYSNELL